MSARQGKVLYSYFFRRKGAIHRKFILEFGTFLRAVNDRPYECEWMTIGCLEFDGDSHESSAHWFGMTMLYDTLASLCKFQICVPQNDTERVRVGTITDHARHDLAVGPADKFPFDSVLMKAGSETLLILIFDKTVKTPCGV